MSWSDLISILVGAGLPYIGYRMVLAPTRRVKREEPILNETIVEGVDVERGAFDAAPPPLDPRSDIARLQAWIDEEYRLYEERRSSSSDPPTLSTDE